MEAPVPFLLFILAYFVVCVCLPRAYPYFYALLGKMATEAADVSLWRSPSLLVSTAQRLRSLRLHHCGSHGTSARHDSGPSWDRAEAAGSLLTLWPRYSQHGGGFTHFSYLQERKKFQKSE